MKPCKPLCYAHWAKVILGLQVLFLTNLGCSGRPLVIIRVRKNPLASLFVIQNSCVLIYLDANVAVSRCNDHSTVNWIRSHWFRLVVGWFLGCRRQKTQTKHRTGNWIELLCYKFKRFSLFATIFFLTFTTILRREMAEHCTLITFVANSLNNLRTTFKCLYLAHKNGLFCVVYKETANLMRCFPPENTFF